MSAKLRPRLNDAHLRSFHIFLLRIGRAFRALRVTWRNRLSS